MKYFLRGLAIRIVIGFAQTAWDSFWQVVREAVLFAEQTWKERGQGEHKKEYLMQQVWIYLDSKGITGWKASLLANEVERQIDLALAKINDELGHDWRKHVDEARFNLAKYLPFIS